MRPVAFHTLNADTNMAALQGYTIQLYKELEQISGQSCGLHHVGGVTLADTPARMDFLKAERAKHRYMGLDTEIVGPNEIRQLSPIINTDGVIGCALRSAGWSSRSIGHHSRVRKSGSPAGGGDLSSQQSGSAQSNPRTGAGR